MALAEEYMLEIEYEHQDGATPGAARLAPGTGSGPDGVAERAAVLRGRIAGRMREAPLVVLFVASVMGFTAFSGLVSVLAAAFVSPDVFVPSPVDGMAGAVVDPVWSLIMVMVGATVAGTAGALLVFWRRVTGWTLLAVYAVWQLVRSYVVYLVIVSQFELAAQAMPSFWAFVDLDNWITMAIRLVFVVLLFLPGVVRWVVAPWREARDGNVASDSPAAFTPAPAPVPR